MSRRKSPPTKSAPTKSSPPKSSPPKSTRKRAPRSGPNASSSSSRAPIAIGVAVVLAIAVLVVLAIPYKRAGGTGRAVDVEVSAGASDAEVLAKLEAAGVVDAPKLFSLYVGTRGGLQAKAGRHLLSDDLSMIEIVRRLRRSPDAAKIKITIPEGFHRFDVAKRLRDKRVCDDQAFLAATIDPTLMNELGLGASAEGYLFPSTYELPANADPADVVRRMVTTSKARIDKLLKQHPAGLEGVKPLGWGMRELVVLASIVEKEAVVDDERPIIASVFLNRIREPKQTGGRLEADPTAGYGCLASIPPPTTCVAWLSAGSTKVNAAIQHDPANRWSTYTHPGLPPTPIANPGEKSLAAVLAPAVTRYFYFVAKGGGRHTFSETLGAHQAATHPVGTGGTGGTK